MPLYIHAAVENANHNNLRVRAFTIENHMTALAKFSVSRLYVIGGFADLGLASKQMKCIIKLLEVFITLPHTPFFGGESANFNHVFTGCDGELI